MGLPPHFVSPDGWNSLQTLLWNSVSLAPEHMSLMALVTWTHLCVTCLLPALDTKRCAVGGCVLSRACCAACLSACRHSWWLHGHLQARPGYRVPVLGSDVPTVCLCSSCRWRPEGRNEGGLNTWKPRLCRRGGAAPQATGQGQWPGPLARKGARQDPRPDCAMAEAMLYCTPAVSLHGPSLAHAD